MMHPLKRLTYAFIICFTILTVSGAVPDSKVSPKISITIKSRAVVLGPEISLGEVSHLIVPDKITKLKLISIKIGNAPPPGESSEIQLSHIRRCLTMAGLEKYARHIKGPRAVRVITAHTEIDKAFVPEEYACFIRKIVKRIFV